MAIFQDFAIFPLVKDKLNNVTNFSGTIMKASRNISLEICLILDDLFIFISLHSLRISSLSVVISMLGNLLGNLVCTIELSLTNQNQEGIMCLSKIKDFDDLSNKLLG